MYCKLKDQFLALLVNAKKITCGTQRKSEEVPFEGGDLTFSRRWNPQVIFFVLSQILKICLTNYLLANLQIVVNLSTLSEAPPIKPPSMSG